MSNSKQFSFEHADAYKRTALVLCGLDQDDKNWILSHLDEGQRDKLEVLIDELQALGLDANSQELIQAITLNHAEISEEPLADESLLDQVDQLSPDQMNRALEGESAAVIAMVVAANHWSWGADYLAMQQGTFREEIRASIKDYLGRLTPMVKAALAESIIERIQSLKA